MLRSLAKYGQLTPVVFCQLDGSLLLVDGFKRLRAARTLQGMNSLRTQFIEVEEQGAKAAIFKLNRILSKPSELGDAHDFTPIIEYRNRVRSASTSIDSIAVRVLADTFELVRIYSMFFQMFNSLIGPNKNACRHFNDRC